MNSSALRECPCGTARSSCEWFLAIALCVGFSGCQSLVLVPQPTVGSLPETQEMAIAAKAYQEILATEPKSQDAHLTQMLERVGKRIAAVSERPDFQWEFTLLSGPKQSAFCLPGGKVAVYEGIFPVCANEAGLAVVLSHEIAHALSRHGGKRMSQQMEFAERHQVFGRLTGVSEAQKVALLKRAYGLSVAHGSPLPFNRTEEAEADSVGLLLMARAGYEPQEAARFWERFSHSSGGEKPELLAVHPSDETRAARLNEIAPRAMSVYQSATRQRGLGEQIPMQALAGLTPKTVTNAAAVASVKPAVTRPVATADAVATSTPPMASPKSRVAAISITAAPIVQVAPAAAWTESVAVSLPNSDVPKVERTLEPPTTNLIVPASAVEENPEESVVTATLTVASPVTGDQPATDSPAASSWVTAPGGVSPAPVTEVANGWKPHGK